VRRDSRAAAALAALAFCALTFALRFASFVGFSNDHYVHLTRGVQMLGGAWPVRDFVDPGLPLMYAVSAAGQALGGRTLLPELTIVCAAFATAAGLTVWTVARWTGSIAIGAWAAAVQVIAFPRSYGYPKVLLYVAAVAAFSACASRPSRTRILGVAALVIVAFLFRHDHGLFLATAAVAVIAIAAASTGSRQAARSLAWFVACASVLVAPFLVHLQIHGGVVPYFASALEFSRREAARTALRAWPSLSSNPAGGSDDQAALLFYALWALPAFTAAILAWRWRSLDRRNRALTAGVVVLAVSVAAGFLRDPLDARVPDAIVPAACLVAWLTARAFEGVPKPAVSRRAAQLAVVLVAGWLALAAAGVGRLGEQLDRAGIAKGWSGVRDRIQSVLLDLRDPYSERQMPSDLAFALVPFFQYVQVCTEPAARLLVPGFAPEVPYYARRGFAGGHVNLFGQFYSSDADQRLTLQRVQSEHVPMVVLPPGTGAQLEQGFPLVAAFVRTSYRPAFQLPVDGQDAGVSILVRRDLQSTRSFGAGEWPCFR